MKKNYLLAFASLAFVFSCDGPNNADNKNYSTTEESIVNENEEPVDGTAVDTGMDTTNNLNGSTTAAPYSSDSSFVSLATSSGIKEVQLGEVAVRSGQSEEVKKFGREMINDHSKVNAELKELARKKNWFPMQRMMPGEKADYNRLSGLKGPEFDKAYMQQMVTDHQKAISLYESAANNATDSDLKAFAASVIPALRMHLDMAQKLNGNTNNM